MTAEIIADLGTGPCSRCKTRERAPHQRYCRYCHAEYMRERRALRRHAQNNLEEALRAIASGRIGCIEHARVIALSALTKARQQ